MKNEILVFLKHMRIHYQVMILSGPFLLGGIFSNQTTLTEFIIQYLNIHILLAGSVTVFNSYYDKDYEQRKPIGGMKSPPPIKYWMLLTSLVLSIISLSISFLSGWIFFSLVLAGIIFSFLYSHENFRMKEKPVQSILIIVITGAIFPFIWGFISFGGGETSINTLLAIIGIVFLAGSFYPVSQIFQIESEKNKSLAASLGVKHVKRFFNISFISGLVLISLSFLEFGKISACLFLISGITALIIENFIILKDITPTYESYNKIMLSKYLGGILISVFLIVMMLEGN
ncbi:MAG TPA: UbiA family prenyltransferase [Candidatus Dojkabacteria bacterium]